MRLNKLNVSRIVVSYSSEDESGVKIDYELDIGCVGKSMVFEIYEVSILPRGSNEML